MADAQTNEPAQTDPTPPEPAPAPFSYTAPAYWQLKGDAGSLALDLTIEACLAVGLWLVNTAPGVYRVGGKIEQIAKASEWIERYRPAPIDFAIEQPPEGLQLHFELTPDRPPPRVARIHGVQETERYVARAIDAGLWVERLGLKHFKVTGPTRGHVTWMSDLFRVPRARALEIMQISEAQAAAEDAALPIPPINVVLPVRETISQIVRDARGDIVNVKQTERSLP